MECRKTTFDVVSGTPFLYEFKRWADNVTY